MRFIIDEDLPNSILNLLHQYNHDAVDLRDVGLRGTTDYEIAAYAKKTIDAFLQGIMIFQIFATIHQRSIAE